MNDKASLRISIPGGSYPGPDRIDLAYGNTLTVVGTALGAVQIQADRRNGVANRRVDFKSLAFVRGTRRQFPYAGCRRNAVPFNELKGWTNKFGKPEPEAIKARPDPITREGYCCIVNSGGYCPLCDNERRSPPRVGRIGGARNYDPKDQRSADRRSGISGRRIGVPGWPRKDGSGDPRQIVGFNFVGRREIYSKNDRRKA